MQNKIPRIFNTLFNCVQFESTYLHMGYRLIIYYCYMGGHTKYTHLYLYICKYITLLYIIIIIAICSNFNYTHAQNYITLQLKLYTLVFLHTCFIGYDSLCRKRVKDKVIFNI